MSTAPPATSRDDRMAVVASVERWEPIQEYITSQAGTPLVAVEDSRKVVYGR